MPSASGEKSPSSERREPSNLVALNAQLYAQGITKSALKLDGLSSKHRDNVIRILQGMLQKRTEDLERTETISTAHRVLSYDHERLCGMHKKLKGRVIAAEKDKEGTKAQMTDLTVKLQREQAAHKFTKDEAQKAKNALAFVRTQAQHDAKKRDAQLEKTLQQWQRLCNDNARVSTASNRGGMLLLNPIDPVQQIPRADSFWDPAINELNQTIISLQEECEAFRHVTLSTANQLQGVLAIASGGPEPARLTPSAFFSAHQSINSSQISSSTSHPLSADTRLRELINKLKSRVEAEVTEKRETARLYQSELDLETLEGERVERVKELMRSRMQDVEKQLVNARQAAQEAQELVLEYAKTSGKPIPVLKHVIDAEESDNDETASRTEEFATAMAAATITDEDKEQLEAEKAAVETERRRMTEGLVRLAQERAVFEAERAAYLEDKRARELEELLREPSKRSPEPSPSSSTSSTTVTTDSSLSQSAPPSTPSRRSASLSTESSRDNSIPHYPPTSAHRLLTPIRSKSLPSVSSPLAGGSRRPDSSSPSKAASPALKRRARKGPATPLARYVSHKIVAEKLASAKKARKLKFDVEDPAEEVVDIQEDAEDAADAADAADTAEGPDARPDSTVSAPTEKRAAALTTSTRDNALSRTRPALMTSKDRLSSLKTTSSRPRVVSPTKATARSISGGRSYMTSTASSAHREGTLKSIPAVKKLEVGQASGMGPARALKKASFR
ncbi:hypothetical protein FFLO_03215 [Filobasidium floriforme]|uniref:Afadin and alpha-actinin-binding-domain-containing protein n=1 Tax=Filobasidium floriforme TaxID=5210 RepID=A0A8K0NR27_9TREE|nr:hypothetical protein FFLO_03215 [Filobasidium floriforme]